MARKMSHAEKAIDLAGRITTIATDALRGLELTTSHWPAEFRAIVWEAVAGIATKRAEAARNEDRLTTAEPK